MRNEELSIATMTWARNEDEVVLIRESMRCLAKLAIPTFITDGGSTPNFVDFLNSLPHCTVLQRSKPGVVAQTKQSLQAAQEQGSPFVLYTESDKKLFFENNLHKFITEAPADDKVGVVLAARSAESFATYPASQQYAETVSNHLCAESFGLETDYFYGPLIVNRTLMPYMELVPDEVGWGWRPFICGIAHRLGYKIIPWVADLPCPPGQQENTPAERLHRLRQLSQKIQGLVLSTSLTTELIDLTQSRKER